MSGKPADPLVVSLVSLSSGETLCPAAADAVDDTRIKNNINTVNVSNIEYEVSLVFIIPLYYFVI
ncbi:MULTISPECIES: hypothetical protein [Methanosarcina]|uniref:hypothetical protein n=1 Tax=Methanosarcina TaxID=2207 RepID=UPI00064F7E38|nr:MULTISPECIES: hypothetical protein [Methanosarcina]WIM42158.1 hypothetical protein PSF70_11530 [Methanosarcina mazei]WIM45717.1 hypothetical protein PQQ20_12040 [Methanosarcina mazei]